MNQALREHVTSANFALVLGSTHIAALVWTDFMLRRNRSFKEDHEGSDLVDREPPGRAMQPRAFNNHATGMSGLYRRGLVVRLTPEDHHGTPYETWAGRRPDETWQITDAGRLVVGLLKEAGLWAEFGGSDDSAPEPAEVRHG